MSQRLNFFKIIYVPLASENFDFLSPGSLYSFRVLGRRFHSCFQASRQRPWDVNEALFLFPVSVPVEDKINFSRLLPSAINTDSPHVPPDTVAKFCCTGPGETVLAVSRGQDLICIQTCAFELSRFRKR
ncbi:hypothetical protein BaRGS_00006537 [Batillaria attramentaria]|uniref:Uncharacterized protein n=1 Tax=Batillaria attramentaria TaxID=370345 RepID=A0ABD0LSV5_9CAEN